MAALTLKTLLSSKVGATPTILRLAAALGNTVGLEDSTGQPLALVNPGGPDRVPIALEGATLGWVTGPAEAARAMAGLLEHLAVKEAERRSLAGEVLNLYREMHLIEHLSRQLAAVLDLPAVGTSALEQARKLIAGSRGGILVRSGSMLRPLTGFGGEGAEPFAPESAFLSSIIERGIAEIVDDCAGDPRASEAERGLGSLLCAPLVGKQQTVGIIALANEAGTPYSTRDLKLLNTIAMQAAAAIENTLLCETMVDAVRDREQLASIQKELNTATTIQQSLIPRTFPPFPERTDFDIHAQMTAASSVGGDFFDFFLLDEDRIGLVIGDVSGKGVPAALFMAVTLTHLRSTAQQGMAPEACLLDVNQVLVREQVSSMFATCFYGILNTRTGELRYCSGGHNPPFILRAATGAVEPLPEVGGLPLGMFAGLGYDGSVGQLEVGDTLLLYTDGVPEGANAAGQDFGDERVIGCLQRQVGLGCRDVIAGMAGELSAFTAGAPQYDDITMLAVRRNGGVRV
jgi:serine phosphatase RsbU (regulator of sigma subunit)